MHGLYAHAHFHDIDHDAWQRTKFQLWIISTTKHASNKRARINSVSHDLDFENIDMAWQYCFSHRKMKVKQQQKTLPAKWSSVLYLIFNTQPSTQAEDFIQFQQH